MVLLFFVTGLLLLYAALIIFYWYHWLKAMSFCGGEKASVPVSVVVAARNEEKDLPLLLKSLQEQTYPTALFEVIIVDDFSTDKTAETVQPFLNERVRMMQPACARETSSKKKAIDTGVRSASGELMIITDADCIVPKTWIATIASYYQKTKAAFIAAPVRFKYDHSLLKKLQAMDFMILQGITAASVSSHFHTMANGANLAYSKQAFIEANGFEGIDTLASGDDMFLMQKIWQKNKHAVAYLKSKDAIVTTQPMHSWKEFINQRKRWAGKSSAYQDNWLKVVLLLVYLFNLLFVVLLIAVVINPVHWPLLCFYLLGKIAIEIPFAASVSKFYNEQKLLPYFILLQPIHIIYTVVIGMISPFGTYRWKGRRTK